jgi:hypothetical protein
MGGETGTPLHVAGHSTRVQSQPQVHPEPCDSCIPSPRPNVPHSAPRPWYCCARVRWVGREQDGVSARDNGDWGTERRDRFCANCGARNPAGASFCNACGTPLREPEPQTIDVSTGEPQVVVPGEERGPTSRQDWQGWQGWGNARVEQGRVYVARGGRRGCLLLNILAILLLCCACWFLWTSVRWM